MKSNASILLRIQDSKFTINIIGPSRGGNIFGVGISDTIFIMLHYPHPKYNEWYFHVQIEIKIGRKQFKVAKIPVWRVDPEKWRR